MNYIDINFNVYGVEVKAQSSGRLPGEYICIYVFTYICIYIYTYIYTIWLLIYLLSLINSRGLH